MRICGRCNWDRSLSPRADLGRGPLEHPCPETEIGIGLPVGLTHHQPVASPQARDSCASGYTSSATAFGPGRDDDERTLWSGEELDTPVHLLQHWWRVAQGPEIPRSLDPAKALFMLMARRATRSARSENNQLALHLTAPSAQQLPHCPERVPVCHLCTKNLSTTKVVPPPRHDAAGTNGAGGR